MKKLFALLLALTMVFSLATTAFAAKITIDDGEYVTGAEYAAYKLLDATDGGDGKFAYTVNTKYEAILRAVLELDADGDIVAAIAEKTDADAIKAFAADVFAAINAANSDEDETNNITVDYTAVSNEFANVDQGYYLIAETKIGTTPGTMADDVISLLMLDTAGKDDIEVDTKEDLPESVKKVMDTNDSTGETTGWQDSADYDIGDPVPFQIKFTLPSNYTSYDKYYVGIHDVQETGLTFNEDVVVYVDTNKNGKKDSDETVITGWFTTTDDDIEDNCTFHIECADVKAKDSGETKILTNGTDIVFEYTSTLNDKAVLGSTGNANEMTIKFSNNPYGDGTSTTPKDKVIVFTYKVNVDKYHKVEGKDEPLTGANFTLYKEVAADAEGNYPADAKTGAAIKAELKAENDKIKADALVDANYYIVVGNKTGDAKGSTFDFKGVDDGKYVLVETTIPDGYNAWNAVAFTISAEHDATADNPTLTELDGGDLFTGEVDANNKLTGTLTTDVENKSGTELPTTGGMGTTLFYIVGGLMVAGAAILLVTKKRMGAEA